jgi:hypothetical protein
VSWLDLKGLEMGPDMLDSVDDAYRLVQGTTVSMAKNESDGASRSFATSSTRKMPREYRSFPRGGDAKAELL